MQSKKKKKKDVQGDDISFYLEDLREISFSNNFKKLLARLIHDGILQHTILQKKNKKNCHKSDFLRILRKTLIKELKHKSSYKKVLSTTDTKKWFKYFKIKNIS